MRPWHKFSLELLEFDSSPCDCEIVVCLGRFGHDNCITKKLKLKLKKKRNETGFYPRHERFGTMDKPLVTHVGISQKGCDSKLVS